MPRYQTRWQERSRHGAVFSGRGMCLAGSACVDEDVSRVWERKGMRLQTTRGGSCDRTTTTPTTARQRGGWRGDEVRGGMLLLPVTCVGLVPRMKDCRPPHPDRRSLAGHRECAAPPHNNGLPTLTPACVASSKRQTSSRPQQRNGQATTPALPLQN